MASPRDPGPTDPPFEESAPALLELVGSIALPTGDVLVAACGAGHDVLSLAAPESVVIGLDPDPGAAARLEALRLERGVPRTFVRSAVGDPFSWRPDGPLDLVWDAAFAPSLPRQRWSAWAARMAAFLRPGGELAVLLFPADDGAAAAMDAALAGDFERIALHAAPRSHPHRQGREWLGRWRRRA